MERILYGYAKIVILSNYLLSGRIMPYLFAQVTEGSAAYHYFGALDHGMLSVEYARNFFDTDQRRLRPLLAEYGGPMLVLHGEADFLVPVDAARITPDVLSP